MTAVLWPTEYVVRITLTRFFAAFSENTPLRPRYTLSIGVLLALAFTWSASAADKPRADFEREILPLFKDGCYQCHDGRKHPSGLRLDLNASALRAGDSGKPPVVPGDTGKSELIRRATSTDRTDFMQGPADDLAQGNAG